MRILLLSTLLAGMFAQVNAAPFQNGGFEVGPNSPVNFCGVCGAPYIGTFFAPYAGITGWNLTAGSVDIIGLPGWSPSEGTRSIDLDGLSAGTLVQTFDTISGATYQVSFDLAANFYAGQTIKSVLVHLQLYRQDCAEHGLADQHFPVRRGQQQLLPLVCQSGCGQQCVRSCTR